MLKNVDVVVKSVFVLLLVAFVGMFMWHSYSNDKKITNLTVTNAQQAHTIITQNKAIDTQEKVAAINEDTQVAVTTETAKVVKKQETVTKRLEEKTVAIDQTFATKPTTVANEVSKQEQISAARIDSLWESYCIGNDSAPECQTTEQGASHA